MDGLLGDEWMDVKMGECLVYEGVFGGAGDVAHLVTCLSSVCEAVDLIPEPTKTSMVARACNPSPW